jgi:hypothetical protein
MSTTTIAIIFVGIIVTIALVWWLLKRRPVAMADRVEPPPGYYNINVTYKGIPSLTKWQSHIPSNYKDSVLRTHPYKIKIEYQYKSKPSIIEYKYASKKTLKDELLIDI